MARRRSYKPKKVIAPHAFNTADLKGFVKRIMSIQSDMAGLREDIKNILIEAAAKGFHKKLINQVVTELKRADKRSEQEKECLDDYRSAVGLFSETPLGAAAEERAEREEKKATKKVSKTASKTDDAFKIPTSLKRQPSEQQATA